MSMDPSELLPIVVAIVIASLDLAALIRVRRIQTKALRLSLITFTGLLAAAALLVAGASVFFYVTYTRHLRPLGSPNGRYVAVTTYTVNNGTGVDEAEVAVRHIWSPYAHRVYTGPAQYEPNAVVPEPALRWADDGHLEIAFHTYMSRNGSVREQGCAASAGQIVIRCLETRVHPAK